jgi:predicted ArsR family transcriptional regulator
MARGLDDIDRRILRELQNDATLSIADLAGRINLSQTPCWKRIQKLEANGVIERRLPWARFGQWRLCMVLPTRGEGAGRQQDDGRPCIDRTGNAWLDSRRQGRGLRRQE